jgi:hypothetical protein
MWEASLKDFYQKRYELQDAVLTIIDSLSPGFYLGGGTALSRFHFDHRYSDDLYFFPNNGNDFISQIQQVSEQFRESGFKYEAYGMSPEFARFHIHDITRAQETPLKIDFINEKSTPHFGEFKSHALFSKIDNPRNILSNKLTFIYKKLPKDVADIWFICKQLSFNWAEIIEEAARKRAIEPLFIIDCLRQFPAEMLNKVQWVEPINIADFEKDRQVIIDNIATKNDNTLCSPG